MNIFTATQHMNANSYVNQTRGWQERGCAAQRPVAIDYPAALALRQMALVQDELPKYLLTPEVSALLHYVPDLHRKMLLATLWNTGARINEALALTRSDFPPGAATPRSPAWLASRIDGDYREKRR